MQSDFDYKLKIFTECVQGGRKYMEDCHSIAYQKKVLAPLDQSKHGNDNSDKTSLNSLITETQVGFNYVFLGVYDGHGGKEAAVYTKNNLLQNIICQKQFWSHDDNDILAAIRDGFVNTHYGMLKEVGKWPKTSSGLPSTSGTTASICFLMNNKYYVGHVGDSKIVLAKKHPETKMWIPQAFTYDHKPDSPNEKARILNAGGKVVCKSGTQRVVWNRPKSGHKGPIRRSTHFDEIPFLAVARSLGDLWSYNSALGTFVVSPEPDVCVIPMDPTQDKCLILASDGLWNMLTEHESVRLLQEMDSEEEGNQELLRSLSFCDNYKTLNPAQCLVQCAMQRWYWHNLRADNTSVVVAFLEKEERKSDTHQEHHRIHNQTIKEEPDIVNKGSEKDEEGTKKETQSPVTVDDAIGFRDEIKCKDPLAIDRSAFSGLVILNTSHGNEYLISASSLPETCPNDEKVPSDQSADVSPDWASLENYFDPKGYTLVFNNGKDLQPRSSLPEGFYNTSGNQKPLQSINDNESNCLKRDEQEKSETVINSIDLEHDYHAKCDVTFRKEQSKLEPELKEESIQAKNQFMPSLHPSHKVKDTGNTENRDVESLQTVVDLQSKLDVKTNRLKTSSKKFFINTSSSSNSARRSKKRDECRIKSGKIVKKRRLYSDSSPSPSSASLSSRSPPAKRLRSSRWSRKVLPSSLTNVWKVTLLTKSRLRAIRCLTKESN